MQRMPVWHHCHFAVSRSVKRSLTVFTKWCWRHRHSKSHLEVCLPSLVSINNKIKSVMFFFLVPVGTRKRCKYINRKHMLLVRCAGVGLHISCLFYLVSYFCLGRYRKRKSNIAFIIYGSQQVNMKKCFVCQDILP